MNTGHTRFKRMTRLLRVELCTMRKAILITLGCIAGLAVLHSFGDGTPEKDFHRDFLGPFLFLGGAVFTSFAFRELKSGAGAIAYMLWPANPLEKFLVKLFSTTVVYALGVTVAYLVGSTVGEGIRYLAVGSSHGIYNPFALENLRMLAGYLPVAAFFLMGAIAFRSYHFVKTVLAFVLTALGVALFAAVVVRIAFAGYFDGLLHPKPLYVHMGIMADHLGLSADFHQGNLEVVGLVGKILMNVVVPALVVVAAYFRFREQEV